MKLYCDETRVIAWHTNDQNVDPSLYGDGVDVVLYEGPMPELERVGDVPENWPLDLADPRSYARPTS